MIRDDGLAVALAGS